MAESLNEILATVASLIMDTREVTTGTRLADLYRRLHVYKQEEAEKERDGCPTCGQSCPDCD